MRKCLVDEFSSIYVFNLRGAIRGKSGDVAKREGQNVFDIMTGVAISILVKNPDSTNRGKIYYYDIGDYLNREDKLTQIKELKSIGGIGAKHLWQIIIPDKYNDWLQQRDDSFYNHIAMGDKRDKNDVVIFENFTLGLATNRDVWVYNYSKDKLTQNVEAMISFYNNELQRYQTSDAIKHCPSKLADAEKYVANFVNNDATKIAWSVNIRYDIIKQKNSCIDRKRITKSLYRPFSQTWCYFDKTWNERTLQLPKIFPESGVDNLVIGVSGIGSKLGFSVLISNILPDLHLLDSSCQCFPLYLYEPFTSNADDLFCDNQIDIITLPNGNKYKRRSAITNDGLKYFTQYYNDTSIRREDIFYYIYGLLHSRDYRLKYADNLTKALPRIPLVTTITDFKNFVTAGRELAHLHLNYENIEMYPVRFSKDISNLSASDYYVTKCKFPKVASNDDKSTIIYNSKITITDIPPRAYDYVVNGKSAIEWVMERQVVSTHKDSGITNDANDWANTTKNNPKYPLELLQRVITVSIKTIEIVATLPKLYL
jgi:predicted helicase